MKAILCITLMLGLSACTAATYKPAGENHLITGYEESPIGQAKYRVSYVGQNDQPSSQIYQWFLLRSAEIAKRDAYPYFKVSDGQAGETKRAIGLYAQQASLPNYQGTVTLLKEKTQDAFDADEIIKSTRRQ